MKSRLLPPMMDVYISVGEWIYSLQSRMTTAVDDTCFHLPTPMHLHAFWLVKDSCFPDRNFKVLVETEGFAK